MRSTNHLRSFIRRTIQEAIDGVPGTSSMNKQVHVFDFDDTLGVTKNSNGIMLTLDGEPAHKDKKDAIEWVKSLGLENDLLPGPGGEPIEKPEGIEGFAVYINSGALTKIRSMYLSQNVKSTPNKPAPSGEGLWIDYTPSSNTTGADPIGPTISKLKKTTSSGSETMVLTARAGESSGVPGYDFSGKKVDPTNEKDIENFLKDQNGTRPSKGVVGLSGGNKGQAIIQKFFAGRPKKDQPEEVHFYDDDDRNTDDVNAEFLRHPEIDAEVYIYGPGHFSTGEVDPDRPTTTIARKDNVGVQKESIDLSRWAKLAGIK